MKKNHAQFQRVTFKTIFLLKQVFQLVFFTLTGLLLYSLLGCSESSKSKPGLTSEQPLVAAMTGSAQTVTPQSGGSDSTCISEADVKEAQKNVQFLETYNPADLCDPSTKTYRLAEAVLFIKNYRFEATDIPEDFTIHMFKNSFWEYFIEEPRKAIHDVGDGPDKNGIAATLGALNDGNIYLFSRFFADDVPLWKRVASLLHEVRHFKVGHENCDKAAGIAKLCDISMEQKGSWAVTMESYAILLKDKARFSEKDRLKIKEEILRASYLGFNEPHEMWATYLIDENNQSYIFDGQHLESVNTIPDTDIFARLFDIHTFPKNMGDNGIINIFDERGEILPPTGNQPQRYLLTDKKDREKILDLILIDGVYATLTSRNLFITKELQMDFKDWSAARIFFKSEYDLGSKDPAYMIEDTQGRLHEIKAIRGSLVYMRQVPNFLSSTKSYAKLKGTQLMLTSDGTIKHRSLSEKSWEDHPRFKGKKFKSMSRAFLWSHDLYEKSHSHE